MRSVGVCRTRIGRTHRHDASPQDTFLQPTSALCLQTTRFPPALGECFRRTTGTSQVPQGKGNVLKWNFAVFSVLLRAPCTQ